MLQISDSDIENRLREDNPWWVSGVGITPEWGMMPRRAYLTGFLTLVRMLDVQRAVLLMGPRRVGKTIMVHHAIHALLESGVPGKNILFVSLETPSLINLTLDTLVRRFKAMFDRSDNQPLYIFFDEIQYLKNWEVHLKTLVDNNRDCKLIATGSAAAALKHKSAESGAGRFTEFVLPPLTFFEFLQFINVQDSLIHELPVYEGARQFETSDIMTLNRHFMDYLNYGGYPEAVFSEGVRSNPRRFIKSDIIDKVLLRDLPSLYGISDVQELNSLFNMLAYNTAQELSLEDLSQSSGVSKPTLSKYLEYLEAAFLIKRLRRVDNNAKQFKKAMTFKVYLTNPTMRSALFSTLPDDSPHIGHLVETAVFSQWLHNNALIDSLCYARWGKGEIDLVSLDTLKQKPRFAIEVKWSDRAFEDPKEIKGLLEFVKKNDLSRTPLVTTKTTSGIKNWDGLDIEYTPTSLHCYTVGRNTLERTR